MFEKTRLRAAIALESVKAADNARRAKKDAKDDTVKEALQTKLDALRAQNAGA